MFLKIRNIFKLLILILTFSIHAEAKLFTNSYISFELPASWDCKLDGTEWVCVSQYEKQAKEAIIIFTAKEIGATDTLESYMQHLQTPRALLDRTGKMVPSQILHVKSRTINNQQWVDGMHMGSEIPSYYTRYLATLKDRIAVLVTFSAHKEQYTKYSSDFVKSIESLRITTAKNTMDSKAISAPGAIGQAPYISPDMPDMGNNLPPEPNGIDMRKSLIALALILAALGFYLWRKKKQ